MAMFTDIRYLDWIEKLPSQYKPYAYLARVDRPIGTWLLLLPAWWSIALGFSSKAQISFMSVIWLFLLFFVGAVVMRAAGCVINDLWDRNIDSQVERTSVRPLASGALTIHNALVFLGLLLSIGFVVLICLNPTTIFLGLLSVPLIVVYPFMKRITFWPQAFLGLTFNFGALMGWSAVTDFSLR